MTVRLKMSMSNNFPLHVFLLVAIFAAITLQQQPAVECTMDSGGQTVCQSTCQCIGGDQPVLCQNFAGKCQCPCGEPPTPIPGFVWTPAPTTTPCRCVQRRDDVACMLCRTSFSETASILITEEAQPYNCMACSASRMYEACPTQPPVRTDCEFQAQPSKQCVMENGAIQCLLLTTVTVLNEDRCGGEPCPVSNRTRLDLAACCPLTPGPAPSLCCPAPTTTAGAPKPTTPKNTPPSTMMVIIKTPTLPTVYTRPSSPSGTDNVICAQLGCEKCMLSPCMWCATSEICLDPPTIQFDTCARFGSVCPAEFQAESLASVALQSTVIRVGNTSVTVTPDPAANSPTGKSVVVSPGKPFRLTFVPPVALSIIELENLGEEEQVRLTATLIENGFSANTTISDPLVDVFAFSKSGFNVYEIAALGTASFRVVRIVFEPAQGTDAVSSTTTSLSIEMTDSPVGAADGDENGALDELTIGLIAGGIALVALIVLILCIWLIKRSRRREETGNLHSFGTSARDDSEIFNQSQPIAPRSHEYGSFGEGAQAQYQQRPVSSANQYDAVTSPL